MQNTTRGRSFTSFPRNTRQRHIKSCAAQAQQDERVAEQVEACYAEYKPTQVFRADEMQPPAILPRHITSCRDLVKDLVRS